MLLPGPEAQQLAVYVGWLLNGLRGGLVAGVLFVVPGFLAIMGLSLVYAASINPVRQKTQAVIKKAWESLGVKVQLKQVDAGIFFDSSAGNDQTQSHFYYDLEMFANSPSDPYPISYMAGWYSNNGENIAQKVND